jgi:hypothetical protein
MKILLGDKTLPTHTRLKFDPHTVDGWQLVVMGLIFLVGSFRLDGFFARFLDEYLHS